MVKISTKHKGEIKKLLREYKESAYDTIAAEMSKILKNYYPENPKKIGKRLLNKLFSSWMKKENEAIVHYWILCKLLFEYQYPSEQLDLEVPCGGIGHKASNQQRDSYADIVVYTHKDRRPDAALIVIEGKALGNQDRRAPAQAASYARALGARYHLITDSEQFDAYETQPHPLNGTPIGDIPKWVGSKPLRERLSKKHILPPLTDEQQLRGLVKASHDQIHAEGIDPAKAFDELVKLFFVKVYDEQELPSVYEFSVLSGETADDTGNHIRQLLKKAANESKFKQLFSEPGDDEFSISNKSIRKVIETFQGFSFTGNSLIGIDAKGTVYESIVGSTFRGELGQYFTPRKMVEFMLDLLQPNRNDIVLDPSCGSGGFLIYALRKVACGIRRDQQNLPQHRIETLIKDFANDNVFGVDLSPRMVRAARMNMIMHGDGWAGIVRHHGLKLDTQAKHKNTAGKFTLILSNPPFAGYENDREILKKYKVGKNESGDIRGVNRALVFVEEIIDLLDEGGRAGLVLPRSIFENESHSFKKLREVIFDRTEILAVIGLPKTAFHHTDCGILGDLLFFQKRKKPRTDYKVFVGWANEVGYNTLGHNIAKNDFPDLLDKYQKRDSNHLISVKKLREEDNINPWFYHPDAQKIRDSLNSNGSNTVPLTDLVTIYRSRISRKLLRETPNRMLKYLEVSAFDPNTGKIESEKIKIRTIGELPSRATYELSGEELLLLPNARNSLESKREVILVGEETAGYILTNRFTPLMPMVSAHYLLEILNTDFVRDQMILACKGAGSPDLRESKLETIMVPVPNKNDLSSIDGFMEEISDLTAKKNRLQQELLKVEDLLAKSLRRIIPA